MPGLVLGELGQPGRLVDRVADHRVFEARLRADVAGNGPARGDTDAELGLAEHPDQLVVQFPRRRQRRAGRVRMFDRGAEDRQRRVALEFVDESAVPVHGVDDDTEELVEQVDDLGGRHGRGQVRGTDQVDEQHRDVAFLAAELGAALQRTARDVLTDVPAEQIAQALSFGQVAHHVVEAGLQQAQLAGVVDLHVRVVVAALYLAECPAQLPQRVGDRHRHQHGAGQPDDQRDDRQQQDRGDQPVGGRGQHLELAGHQREHDGQHRHARGQHPGQHLAQDHPGRPEVLRYAAAQRRHGDGPQHTLGLQVADDRGGRRAQTRRHRHHRGRFGGHRPARHDEHHRAEQPVRRADQRAVERHLQRPHPGDLGLGGVPVAQQRLPALPAHHRDQHAQRQIGRDRERDEQVAEEDGQVVGGQVLQLDAVLGR